MEEKNMERGMNSISGKPAKSGKLKRRFFKVFFILFVVAAAVYFGKDFLRQTSSAAAPSPAQDAASATPLVRVREAEIGDVSVTKDYIGVVEAIQTVSLRPEVSAKIERVHFKEGAYVKAGDILFTLDDRQFQATAALRRAEVAKAQANYDKAKKYHERLNGADKRSVSAADLDAAYNDMQQGKAAVDEAKASLQLAQIDLNNAKITAPISGKIGRTDFTKGNYVSPSGEALATIVQTDPVRVAFSLPDREYLEDLDAFNDAAQNVYTATLRLANNEAFPYKGTRDFEDNAMDADSGTISLRIRFKNDKNALVPGSMVRVSLAPRQNKTGVLIPQESVLSDRDSDYVYTVDADGVARKRGIVLGAQVKGYWSVMSGIEAGELVVVQGMQSLRADTKVRIAETKIANAGSLKEQ